MPVNLSIKNAPDRVVEKLRQKAQRDHRSLQGELMAIIEASVGEAPRPETGHDVVADAFLSNLQSSDERI